MDGWLWCLAWVLLRFSNQEADVGTSVSFLGSGGRQVSAGKGPAGLGHSSLSPQGAQGVQSRVGVWGIRSRNLKA